MQITSAMKMVSAAKLKKAQDAITAMRPYSSKLTELLSSLSATLDSDSQSQFAIQRKVNKVLVIGVTSNRGLAGAFNSSITKEVSRLVREDYAGKEVSFIAVGKKMNDMLSRAGLTVRDNQSEVFDDLTFDRVAMIAQAAMDAFTAGEVDRVVLVYNRFKNAATQITTVEQFLPILPIDGDATAASEYIYEPNVEEIVEQLIPKSLKMQMYKAVRDSFASEHGARMTAMHKATDNAGELRDSLKLTYNKARQAAITNEILEIVGGAEALAG